MGYIYTHVNAQFQVISVNIPKDNCAFSTIVIMQRDVISMIIYISNKPRVLLAWYVPWHKNRAQSPGTSVDA